jgi:hypothetical protein
MKPILSIVVLLLIITTARAQSFIGYSSGNYTGVNGVFFNPAYAANSRYHWDFNLVQVNASVYNNAVSYKLGNLTKSFNSDAVLNKLYGAANANALENVDVLGPSLLFNINSKTAFAFTTRYREFGNMRGINGILLQSIKSEDAPAAFGINNCNMQVAATGWMEAGVTWANVLYNNDKHFLKGGISVKYLGGISNAAVSTHNLNASIELDPTKENYFAANASGDINLRFAGASPSHMSFSDLTKFHGHGAGIDIGLSYEYRPNSEEYKSADGSYDGSENLYKVRASVALLDMGSISFNKDPQRSGTYAAGFTGSDQFDLSALNTDIDKIKDALDANPGLFTPVADATGSKYKVSLPARLMTEVDYHFNKGFYLNLAGHMSLAKSNDIYKMNDLNRIIITPRIETPFFGFYVPLQVNNMTGFDAGLGFRIGKLVVGSSNILTALGSSKMVNAYVGLRFLGSTQKRS